MADRGRDLKFSILSDVDQFDTDKPAKGLEDLGDAAELAGRRLVDLDRDADRPSRSMDSLGRTAVDVAGDVDRSFDKIARSSKAAARKVDADLDDAGAGMNDFKDEAAGTAREVGASFSGSFDDVAGGIQETLANALAGFGPIGAAAGLAAAAGIGLLTKGLQDATDKANAAKDRVIQLSAAIRDVGGDISKIDVAGKIAEWDDAIADNKSWFEVWQKDNTTNLEKFSDEATKAGLKVTDFVRGMSGHDIGAASRSLAEIETRMAANAKAAEAAGDHGQAYADTIPPVVAGLRAEQDQLRTLRDELNENGNVTAEAIARYKEKVKVEGDAAASSAALEAATKTLTDRTDAAAKAEADRQAALVPLEEAIRAVGEAEITRKDGTVKSIDEIIAAQEKELKAKARFEKNTKEVFKEVGQAGVDWALAQGPNAAAAMQLLADAPKKKQAEIAANYTAAGTHAGEATAAGLVGSKPAVFTALDNLHAGAAAHLDALSKLGIKVGVDGATIPHEASLAIAAVEQYFRDHPVTIKASVVPVKPGQNRFANNGNNSRYRDG